MDDGKDSKQPTHRTVNDGELTRINGIDVVVKRKPGKGRRYRVTVRPIAVDNGPPKRQDSA